MVKKSPPSMAIPIRSSSENEKSQMHNTSEIGYDPHEYGHENGLTFWEAMAHYIKSAVGTGILVVPFAFKSLGYALGLAVILSVGILYYHTMHILISCEYRVCKRLKLPKLTLVGVTKVIFENTPPITKSIGKFFEVAIYIYFGIPMTCSLYLIVLGTNIQCILEYVGVEGVNLIYPTSIVFLCLLAFCLIGRLLKFLAPFSALSDTFMLFMAGIVLVSSFIFGEPRAENIKPYDHFLSVPQFFGVFLMGVRSTGIIMPLKNEMTEPRRFSTNFGVLNLTAVLILSFYSLFGLINYLNFGDRVRDNILLNLPQESIVSLAINTLNTFALFVSYVLTFFVNFHTVWAARLDKKSTNMELVFEYGVRIGINVLTYMMAVGIPHLSLIAAISGTIGITVEIILPPILEILLILSSGTETKHVLMMLKNLLIILVGLSLFGTSAFQCANQIVKLYRT